MSERRAARERRHVDAGPPKGCCERRRRADRRLSTAEEVQMSADDFERFFGSAKAASGATREHDAAAEVFGRVWKG